jgi:DNA-binding SARP family transcriptional activator/pimeloyl-ACP methyl ester carboxylesterase
LPSACHHRDVQFEVLGPLRVLRDGVEIALRPRQRAVLARLLVTPNRAVGVDQLLDELWPDPSTPGALSSLQAQLSKLRAALGEGATIERTAAGYRAVVDESDIDAYALEQHIGESRTALLDGRPEDALAAAESALALCRGEPLADIADTAVGRSEIARLAELRAVAAADRLRALIDVGRPEHALADLVSVLDERPYDERFWGLRMLALHRAGRSADALEAYQAARRCLAEDLGLEPGHALRSLESRILTHDPALDASPARRAASASAPVAITVRDLPPVQYTRNGEVHLAYRVLGEGDLDVVWVPDYLHHLDVTWEHESYARWLTGLASLGRLITYDKRGQGLSDRTTNLPSIEARVADLLSVLDAAGASRPVLVGSSEGAMIAAHLAASHPDRVRGLAFFGSAPSGEGFDTERYLRWAAFLAERWGTGRSLEALAPSVADDPAAVAWYGRLERHTIGPSGLLEYIGDNANADYRHILDDVDVPAVVIHRGGEKVPIEGARQLAAGMRNARFVELDGVDHLPWFGDADAVLDEIRAFVAEVVSPVAARR